MYTFTIHALRNLLDMNTSRSVVDFIESSHLQISSYSLASSNRRNKSHTLCCANDRCQYICCSAGNHCATAYKFHGWFLAKKKTFKIIIVQLQVFEHRFFFACLTYIAFSFFCDFECECAFRSYRAGRLFSVILVLYTYFIFLYQKTLSFFFTFRGIRPHFILHFIELLTSDPFSSKNRHLRLRFQLLFLSIVCTNLFNNHMNLF